MALGNTRFTTQHGLQVVGNTEIEQNLLVLGSANVVGDLTVGGSMVFSANIIGNFMPDVSGRALGNTTNRWELYANAINVANTSTFGGAASPTSNGINLGDTTTRWFAYTTDISTSNSATVSNNVTVGNTLSVTTTVNIGTRLAIQSNTTSYANAVVGQTVVDAFSATSYRTAKYLIEVRNATTGYMAEEMLLTHDGSTVFVTSYGTVNSVAVFCSFDADISGGNVRLLATPTTNATFKVARSMIV
jgi:trimeric autotransporter adhesin